MSRDDRVEALLRRFLELHERDGKEISAEELCRDEPELLDTLRARVREALAAERTLAAPEQPLQSGQAVSHYRISRPLGAGGMGVVYEAEDTTLERRVALKFLSPSLTGNPQAKERFLREARAASALDHPNICTVYEIGEGDGGRLFMAMARYRGETLRERLNRGPLSSHEAAEVAQQVTAGLAAAHGRGILHRDIKPGNLFVTDDGLVKILDFGIAKVADQTDLTVNGEAIGTVAYMSPEQARGHRVDARSDLWSLGVVLYEMTAGRLPFRGGNSQAMLYAIVHEKPAELDAVPRQLRTVIERTLAKEPQDRYSTAQELGSAIERMMRGKDSGPSVAASSQPSIVVLSFADMSPQRDQEHFCDGMAEEVINALTQLPGLRVVARTSAFQFKGKNLDVREIGAQLGVSAVLEGSVRRAGNRLRVTAQLVDVTDGYHLWSQRYDRPLDDVFAIQDEISASIVEGLKVKLALGSTPIAPREVKPTENQDAYDFYLRGVHYYWLTTKGAYERAVECFERAIALDPEYARAYAALSLVHAYSPMWSFRGAGQALVEGEAAARRALALDDSLAEAHTAAGAVRAWLQWDLEGAEPEFRRAVELNPGHVLALNSYAFWLCQEGRLQEAVAEIRKAHALDPLSWFMTRALGEILTFDRQYDEAIRHLSRSAAMSNHWTARQSLAVAYAASGRPADELRMRVEILERSGRDEAARELELAYTDGGEPGMLRWYLSTLLHRARPAAEEDAADAAAVEPRLGTDGNRAAGIAFLYARLGETEEAFHWLDEAVRQRGHLVLFSKVHPALDRLRPDPRFRALLQRIGLE